MADVKISDLNDGTAIASGDLVEIERPGDPDQSMRVPLVPGVESDADVTDAENVGGAIHGSDAKTTPHDNDTLPLIDSEASNVLKKITWANVKSAVASALGFVTGVLGIAAGGTGQSTASAAFGALKQTATDSATGVLEKATDAEVRSSSGSDQAVLASHLSSALGAVALTDGAPVAVDWSAGIYFTLTVTANRQIANPSNEVPGQTRYIRVVGNSGTSRTITFGNEFVGDIPTITDCTSSQPYLLIITCAATSEFIVTARALF